MIDTKALTFACEGSTLHGILDRPEVPGERAVLIIVGGPQYRVGSHRQFTLLSRFLASKGLPTMRFDHRGIGDSDGEVSFDSLQPDIVAAANKLCEEIPEVREIVLWGLCDAASAAMMYGSTDERVKGMILLNPWARSDKSLAQTYLKRYYATQFVSFRFWRRLLSGKINVLASFRSVLGNLLLAIKSGRAPPVNDDYTNQREDQRPFQERMEEGLRNFGGRVLFIMSGEDLTAAEFKQLVSGSRRWQKILSKDTVSWHDLPASNHTFSRKEWRSRVERWSHEWISSW